MAWSQVDAVRWVMRHPLNRNHQVAALLRWTSAQLCAHVLQQVRLVPFVDGTRLYVGQGLTAANMQHYAGLGELDVMGFLMHYLLPTDLLADIGGNVGVITVLASGVAGARTLAFEPDKRNFHWLERNVSANSLAGRVQALKMAVGEASGTLRLTSDLGASNRAACESDRSIQEVRCGTLDRLCADDVPTVIKADIEGFEVPMLRGAAAVIANPQLSAVVLELKNHGKRYGFDEGEVFSRLAEHGFSPFTYEPFERRLIALNASGRRPHNTIFLRDPMAASTRLTQAPKRRVIWGQRV